MHIHLGDRSVEMKKATRTFRICSMGWFPSALENSKTGRAQVKTKSETAGNVTTAPLLEGGSESFSNERGSRHGVATGRRRLDSTRPWLRHYVHSSQHQRRLIYSCHFSQEIGEEALLWFDTETMLEMDNTLPKTG